MKPSLIIIGLGNPGAQYERTRHNVGWQALDLLSEKYGEGEYAEKQKFLSHICEARIGVTPILLVKPQTFMNLSGNAVRKLVDFYKIDPSTQLLVLCDDIDLPLGTIRYREKGGPGTHNGLKSINEQISEGYQRIRIGLGQPSNPAQDLAAWVLSIPSDTERIELEKAFMEVCTRVGEIVGS